MKRADKGVHHAISVKYLRRYVSQFTGRHNVRDMDTLDQMQHVLARMVGRQLVCRDLVGDTAGETLAIAEA